MADPALGRGGKGRPGGYWQVSGSGRNLVLAGPCALVEVGGSRNSVQVRLAPGARVVVSGSGNQMVWSAADPAGVPPRLQVNGTRNRVEQAR